MKTKTKQESVSLHLFFLLCLTLFTLGSIQQINAQEVRHPHAGVAGSWQLIGTTQARFTADHDGITVAGPFDNFRKIKLKVTDAPLHLVRMVVTYDNGVPDEIPTAFEIPQGGESRVIDLRGIGTRSVRRIDFWYDTKGKGRGRANVSIFGMK